MASSSGKGDATVVRELTIRAEDNQLGRVRDFIVEVCEEAGFGRRETSNTKLAVDEACTNIVKHAYSDRPEVGDITILTEISPGAVSITLCDYGQPFDFAGVENPDLDEYVETGRKGGFGVFLINRLLDGVEYRSIGERNELVLTKRSQAAISARVVPGIRPLRDTLRYKFTVRAVGGFLALMVVLWGFIFMRQTHNVEQQMVGQWIEKKRTAENLARSSVDLLIKPGEFSIEQTNLSTQLTRFVASNDDIAWARVVTSTGEIVSSGSIDEIFTKYEATSVGDVIAEDGDTVWRASI
ncbi:MAG: ATP-binding protein, partial [Candidatus Krumholzibacteriota bacterium]|nr:ATP-binding protein [Candidatus Krumholzibacteriota bacterium]